MTSYKLDVGAYLESRINDQIRWYDKKSFKNKWCYFGFHLGFLFLSSLVPLVSLALPTCNILVAVLGAVAAFLAAMSSLMKFKDNWVHYRTTAEALKHEKFKFCAGGRPYDGDDAFGKLIDRIECIVSQEHSVWLEYQTDKDDKNPKSNGT